MQNKSYCRDFFYDRVMKQFIEDIMEKRGREVRFINKVLIAQTRPVNSSQWKRKQGLKEDICDICRRRHPVSIVDGVRFP